MQKRVTQACERLLQKEKPRVASSSFLHIVLFFAVVYCGYNINLSQLVE